MQLNEDLTEAISLGHDLGHTPFGHAGERALNALMKEHGGFYHYLQSVRIVECLENDGKGLNLTKEVRDGIERHTCGEPAKTLEGRIVRLADIVVAIWDGTSTGTAFSIKYARELGKPVRVFRRQQVI